MSASRFYDQPRKCLSQLFLLYLIISYSGSALYKLNKYRVNIVKAYVKDETNNTKNLTTFTNYIRNVPIEENKMMVSFGVTTLCADIAVVDT